MMSRTFAFRPALLLAFLLLVAAGAPVAVSAAQTQCATPNVCAAVTLEQSVHTASLYGATQNVRVTAAGTIQVTTERGHFVDLAVTLEGPGWQASISPASPPPMQTSGDVPFSAVIDVPTSAPEGRHTFTVRVDDSDGLFPIHSSAEFSIEVYRGPLALYSQLTSASPRPGESASWTLTLRNLASFEIDFNPIFDVPAGHTPQVSLPATQLLQPGEQAQFTLSLAVPANATPGEYEWSVHIESATHPELGAAMVEPFIIRPAATSPPGAGPDLLSTYWLPITLGLFAVGAVIAFSLTEVGYLALAFSLFSPLFSRLKKEHVLDNFTRGEIFGWVRANPGAHYSAIQQALEVENGVLAYHLRVLLRENYLVARSEGVYKRFYPRDYKIPKRRTMLTRLQVDILEEVARSPASTQRDVAKALGESKQVVSYNVGVLRDAGLLRAERYGRAVLLYAVSEEAASAPAGAETSAPSGDSVPL